MLDTGDIQGNILAGFNTDHQTFVALALRAGADRSRAVRWLGSLAEEVSTADEVRSARKEMIDLSAPAPWLAVALSQRVMEVACPNVVFSDPLFRRGMAATLSALGDETSPDSWAVGGQQATVDVLFIVAANDPTVTEQRAEELIQQAAAEGFDCSYRETGARLPGGIEHFGFRDGISQPVIAASAGPGSVLPGHFIFGQPVVEGGQPVNNLVDPGGFTHNGSLLVFRRLAQNVEEFHRFFEAKAVELRGLWPGLTAAWLKALVVGRWPSGALASTQTPVDPGAGGNDDAFDFSDDLEGRRCPLGAHIRKVNPRNGFRDEVDVPRILRRGIPFGPGFPAVAERGRGLLFVAYQTSIQKQFAFLSGSWMNRPDRPQAKGGHDLLVGRARNTRSLTLQGPQGPVEVSIDGPHWVTPTGGAYLFAPSRRALAMLGQPGS